ncbi:Rieske (2Fe-2S) protein [Mycobacterium persicum]|uniref:Rieske (2Fe-2S) protein n=1 Tax=Mycobacterium persicum TaxID=1487726 RepID=UPI00352DA5BA
MRLVDAGKFGVGVYNVGGALYAIGNYCPHEDARLCRGLLGGRCPSTAVDPRRRTALVPGARR